VQGAGGQHLSVSDRDLPGAQRRSRLREGSRIQGPGGADRGGGGGGGHPEPGPQPGGGGAELAVLFGAGGAAGVDGGQALEPTGLESVDLGLQLQGLFGQGGVGQPVEVLGEEGVDLGGVERISAADS